MMIISFIIPVFNAGDFLTEALESILQNKCVGVEFEIVIVNDVSTDPQTLKLLSILEANGEAKVIHHQKNSGPAKARNTGIRASTGTWITFLDADDILAPGTMERRLTAIKELHTIEWLASDMLEIRKPGELTHHKMYPVNENDGTEVLPGIFELKRPTKKLVNWSSLPIIGSMMIKRELIFKIGLFNEKLTFGEDVHFCLLATCYADLYWMTWPCLYLRRHHESMTKDRMRMARESPRYSASLLADRRLRIVSKELRWQHAAALRHLCRMSLVNHFRFQAVKAAVLAIICMPHDPQGFRLLLRSVTQKTGGNLSDI